MQKSHRLLKCFFAFSLCMPALHAAEAPISNDSQRSIALTIYNQNFGIVQDQRKVHIPNKTATLEFDNVAEQIQAASVVLRSLTDSHLAVLEQYYAYDLSSSDAFLQKQMNKPLTISLKDGSHYTGDLVHFDSRELILQEGDKLTLIPRENNVKEIHFNPLAKGFYRKPSLIWEVATDQPGEQQVEISYQTLGLNWQADYNALLHSEEDKMDLQAWVTLSNESGTTYEDAELKLMAGETKSVQPVAMMANTRSFSKQEAFNRFQEAAFFEYHLYTLERPITLMNHQTKQVQLFKAVDVPVKKRFVYEGAPYVSFWHEKPITEPQYGSEEGNKKVQVLIEFENSLDAHLGMPLPQGTLRFYKQNLDQTPEFIGENKINPTPKEEKVELAIGNAFDVIGYRKRVHFQVDLAQRIMTEKFEIQIQNHRSSPIEVLVKEPLYRWNSWEILSSSLPFEKQDASTVQFHVPVEKNGKQILNYTVRYSW